MNLTEYKTWFLNGDLATPTQPYVKKCQMAIMRENHC